MKKIWFLLVMMCSVCAFTACSDDDDNEGEGTPVCPVKGAALDKTTAKAGDEMVLTGEGFAAGAKLALEKDAQKTAVSVWEVAADGKRITFVVPEVEEGSYQLFLTQDGEWDLKLTLKVEKKALQLTGLAYDDGEKGEKNFAFKFTYTDGRPTAIQKADAADPGTWLDYMTVDYSGQDKIKVRAFMENVDAFSGLEGWQDYFTLVLDNGRVKHVIDKDAYTTSDWTYTEKGYVQVASNSQFLSNGYVYGEEGNLTQWKFMNEARMAIDFVHEGTVYPNVTGFELGALYALIKNNAVIQPEFYAHLFGVVGQVSASLPSGIKGFKSGAQVVFGFTYSRDKDGLVREFSVKQPYNYWDEDAQEMVNAEATKKVTFTWE